MYLHKYLIPTEMEPHKIHKMDNSKTLKRAMPKSVIRISVNRLTCLDFGVSFVLHQYNKTEIERH